MSALHDYFDRLRAARCAIQCIVVPPPLVPTPLHDYFDRDRAGKCAFVCGTTPPPSGAFDFIGAAPTIEGSAYTGGDAEDPFILDWGLGGGESGTLIMDANGSITDMIGVIEPGANTVDDLFRVKVFKNLVEQGSYIEWATGTDGQRTMTGSPIPYAMGDSLAFFPFSDGGSGSVTDLRLMLARED